VKIQGAKAAVQSALFVVGRRRTDGGLATKAKRGALLIAAIAIIPYLQPGLPAAANSATCSLAPSLAGVTINQGLGSYTPLVRGKDTLVRFYLSLPANPPRGTSMAFNGGSLSVSNGATILSPTATLLTSTGGQIVSSTSAPTADSPGDPRFLVPGATLAAGSSGAAYTATFSPTIQYLLTTTSGGTKTTTACSATYTTPTGSAAPITAQIDRKTNALRILVAPMGDQTKLYSSQFSANAQSAVQNGMLTLSRIFPVESGTADLSATSGGVRYTILPTLAVNLGSLLSTINGVTGFCGSGSNWSTISAQLSQFLQSYNAANPSTPADRILGAVDKAISFGSASGCAEGMGGVNTSVAWVRADYATTPSRTGALMSMEIGHTLGLVPSPRYSVYSAFHSPNTPGDLSPTQTLNRTYDETHGTYIASNDTNDSNPAGEHSAMNLQPGWADSNTLLEQLDYSFARCQLGGTADAAAGCGTTPAQPVGTSVGVGANPLFRLDGFTDGVTPASVNTLCGTNVVESFADPTALQGSPATTPVPSSTYRLRFYDSSGALQSDIGVPVPRSVSNHGGPGATCTSAIGLVALAVPFNTNWTRAQFVNGTTVLYSHDRNSAPPTVISVTSTGGSGVVQVADFTTPPPATNFNALYASPAVSLDGRWIAYTISTQASPGGQLTAPVLWVAPSNNVGAAKQLTDTSGSPSNATMPSWRPDGMQLAYVWQSQLFTVGFDPKTGNFVGSPQFVTEAAGISHPTWSADGSQLAFDNGFDIYRVNVDRSSLTQLTHGDGTTSTWPSWSPPGGPNRIVFSAACSCSAGTTLQTLDPTTIDSGVPIGGIDGGQVFGVEPSWGAPQLIAYNDGQDNLKTVAVTADASHATGFGSLTSGSADSTVSLSGNTFAFQRGGGSCIDSCPFPDIWLGSLGTLTQAITATATTSGLASDLRFDVYFKSGSGLYLPVAVGLPPLFDSTLHYSFDSSLTASGGTLTVTASDGFDRSSLSSGTGSTTVTSLAKSPVVTIDSWLNGRSFDQYDGLTFNGTAKDAQDGQLFGSHLMWSASPTLPGLSANGDTVRLVPPAGGWTPGSYAITLAATDSNGTTVQTTAQITILRDDEHDGISEAFEAAQPSCNGHLWDQPGINDADVDFNNDGISNGEEIANGIDPCALVTSFKGLVIIFPQKISLSSTGPGIAAAVGVPYQDLTKVASAANVKITMIGSTSASLTATFWVAFPFPATSLLPHITSVGVATFGQQAVIAGLKTATNNGANLGTVQIVITETTPTLTFTETASVQVTS
jgi:Tol biopolymer transport system component